MQQYIVGLDIGTAAIKAAVAEIKRGGEPALVSVLKMPSGGVRRGTIDNVVDATHALSAILTEIKKISRSAIKNIILGVATPDIKVQYSKGVVAVSRADDEIYQDDVSRVVKSAQAIKYWSKITNSPECKFDRIYYKKNKIQTKRKNIGNDYHGLLRICIKKSTNLNRRIAGWIEGMIQYANI